MLPGTHDGKRQAGYNVMINTRVYPVNWLKVTRGTWVEYKIVAERFMYDTKYVPGIGIGILQQ